METSFKERKKALLTIFFILDYGAVYLWSFFMMLMQLVSGTKYEGKSFGLRWSRGMFAWFSGIFDGLFRNFAFELTNLDFRVF